MSPLSSILLIILLFVLAGLIVVMQRRHKERLQNANEKQNAILAEERRLFAFLHDLGESLSHDSRRNAIHRLIVEGAQRVTDSGGGALYLLDESQKSLVPKFLSEECSPLVALPERIVAMAKQNPSSLLSFLRLHAVGKDVGVLGAVFTSQQPEIVANLKRDDRFGSSNNPLHLPIAAMICPISCGARPSMKTILRCSGPSPNNPRMLCPTLWFARKPMPKGRLMPSSRLQARCRGFCCRIRIPN
jgi:phosphoserine phosphatase RsbU/P